MERDDMAAVCRLLDNAFGNRVPIHPNWREVIEWLYFSPAIKDQTPRAFVIVDKRSVVGHIGLTLSEFTNGDQLFSVVQTENWVVNPDYKVGLLSLRLMGEAISLGDAAIIIGGSEDTRRIIPKIGFKKQLDIDRYLKVIKPAHYLAMSRSGKRLLRNTGKLIMFLANSPQSLLRAGGKNNTSAYQIIENNGHDPIDSTGSDSVVVSPSPRRVLRNTLNPKFLDWYKQCPQGIVHTLKFHDEARKLIGQAAVLIQSRRGNCYANLVNVDANTEDSSVWSDIVDSAERFLIDKGVTHINTVATFEPLRRALSQKNYCRVNYLPLWVRDKNNRLGNIEAWHITAIEGDLGYLFE
jgi:hypothetical protein